MAEAVLFTVGHGTADADELLARLAQGQVASVVDVRTAPGSRRSPHLARDALAEWLPAAGLGYRWEPRLGGFRRAAPDSPDVVLRNASFRGYAGHLRTPDARDALAALVADARSTPTAVMCSETVWWRCHRRLIADAVELLSGTMVCHLLPGRVAPHRLTEGVRVARADDGGEALVYDGGQERVARPDGARPDGARVGVPPEEMGGDQACWLDRVCQQCGRLTEHGDRCAACGAPLGDDVE